MKNQDKTREQLMEENELLKSELNHLQKTEHENREQKKLLETIVENYPNSYISIIEKDLTVSFSFGQEFKNQNINPQVFYGLSLKDVFGEDEPIIKEHYLKTFVGEEQTFEMFINNQHQLYKTVPLLNEKGEIDRILAVVENNSERKKTEKDIILAKENAERYLDLAGSMILSLNPQGEIVMINQKGLEILEYSREELIGKN